MKFPMIDAKISDQIVNAICHTLAHSLWQGLLLALAGGMIILATRNAKPSIRYNLLVSALGLFFAGVIVTFVLQCKTFHSVVIATNDAGAGNRSIPVLSGPVLFTPRLTDIVSAYLNSHHTTIVLVWFLLICARSIQLGTGLYSIYRLKHVQVHPVSRDWEIRFRELMDALGIRRMVRLLESGLVKVPSALGHFKPVVLVPVGLLTALSPGEVEAILLHELAHIRRHDFLVNLLQHAMEIIFFFNPAVLWISQLIKTERENCCDDIALRQSNNRTAYIRALLLSQEYRSGLPAQALAFHGNTKGLLARVNRMALRRNRSLSLVERTVLALCLTLSGVLMSAATRTKTVPPRTLATAPLSLPSRQTSLLPQQTSLQPRQNGNIMLAAHPADRIAQPRSRNPISRNTVTTKQDTSTLAHLWQGITGDTTPAPEPTPATRPTPEGQPPYAYQAGAYRSAGRRYQAYHQQLDSLNKVMLTAILTDLQKDGIIQSSKDDLEFRLTGQEFIINGEPQKDAIFQRYKQKYVPGEGSNGWTWTHSQHSP